MAIKIINDKCKGCSLCAKACPFDALKIVDRLAIVDEGKCTNCNACIAKCKFDAIEAAPEAEKVDLSAYKHIWVFAEQQHGHIEPSVFELLAKARELAAHSGEEVTAVLLGCGIASLTEELFARGADLVAVNNGGDVALRLGEGRSIRMGILPDLNGRVTEIVEIRAEDGIGGVCTSGLGGRSLTRGIAGGVTVFSRRCALADACATHIANCSYIESPRVHTCLAGEIEPESDIASLRIVTAVEPLFPEEKKRGLMQVYEETERQWKNGNLVRVYADIQGERLTFERSAQ